MKDSNLFDSVCDGLSHRWKPHHAPRTKRAFRCVCGASVFFRNTECSDCHAPLGYEHALGELRSLLPGRLPETWRPVGDDIDRDYRRCGNFVSPAGCNWLVRVDSSDELCLACGLSRQIPNLEDNQNRNYWRVIEFAKRRLISQLLGLGLPIVSRRQDPERGLAFDLLRSPEEGPRVLTGHASGLITINVEEADDSIREKIRADLHEPYRTLLGHFRHEIGHYYWDRLIWNTPWLQPFRELFGDERADYAAAIRANYEQGPPPDWREKHISAYAASHPWEDWAETWAHYLHIVDSLDTALAHGLEAADLEMDVEPFTRADLYDPNDEYADRNLFLLNAWLELVALLNEMARSLGHRDFYPFAMQREVVKKLHFVSLVVRSAQPPLATSPSGWSLAPRHSANERLPHGLQKLDVLGKLVQHVHGDLLPAPPHDAVILAALGEVHLRAVEFNLFTVRVRCGSGVVGPGQRMSPIAHLVDKVRFGAVKHFEPHCASLLQIVADPVALPIAIQRFTEFT